MQNKFIHGCLHSQYISRKNNFYDFLTGGYFRETVVIAIKIAIHFNIYLLSNLNVTDILNAFFLKLSTSNYIASQSFLKLRKMIKQITVLFNHLFMVLNSHAYIIEFKFIFILNDVDRKHLSNIFIYIYIYIWKGKTVDLFDQLQSTVNRLMRKDTWIKF